MKGCACWWTVWAKEKAFENKEKVSAGDRSVRIEEWKNETRKFVVEAGNTIDVRVATFYYPYWKAKINGEKAEIKMGAEGEILIPVKGEKSEVKLYFSEPAPVKIALGLSILTWIILLGSIFLIRTRINIRELKVL